MSSPVTLGAMVESFLRRNHVRLFTMPDFQGRLLNGAAEGERQLPGKSRLVPDVHRIETGRGKFAGLTARQEDNSGNGGGNRAQQTADRCVGYFLHRLLSGASQTGKHHIW